MAITPHSHHEQFIDPRRIICTACLQADFHSNNCWGRLPPTSTGCIKDLLLQTFLFAVVSEGAFHGVTRSFHSSNYQLEIINPRCFYIAVGFNPHAILYSNVSLHITIGKALILSLPFPPSHTVHESFPSHGVQSQLVVNPICTVCNSNDFA